MTKSEKIKQLSDTELASEINDLMARLCRQFCRGCPETKYRCDEAVLKYLKSEVE